MLAVTSRIRIIPTISGREFSTSMPVPVDSAGRALQLLGFAPSDPPKPLSRSTHPGLVSRETQPSVHTPTGLRRGTLRPLRRSLRSSGDARFASKRTPANVGNAWLLMTTSPLAAPRFHVKQPVPREAETRSDRESTCASPVGRCLARCEPGPMPRQPRESSDGAHRSSRGTTRAFVSRGTRSSPCCRHALAPDPAMRAVRVAPVWRPFYRSRVEEHALCAAVRSKRDAVASPSPRSSS